MTKKLESHELGIVLDMSEVDQIKDRLSKIQDIAICLDSDSASNYTPLEMKGVVLEHTIEIWRILKASEKNKIEGA